MQQSHPLAAPIWRGLAPPAMGPLMPVFAHLTDLHLRPPGTMTLGTVDADRFVVAAVDTVNAKHPDVDAVLVTGDLADLGEEEAYARAAMLLARFSVPVLVIPGNHDSTEVLRSVFSAFPGMRDPRVAGKVCHAVEIGGVTVVSLDTSVDGCADGRHHGTLGGEQLDWLEETLRRAGPSLIAMHHPPLEVGIPFMDRITLTDAHSFAEVIARNENVLRIVCGHVHRTIVGEVAGVPVIAVPGVAHQVQLALSPSDPPGMVMEPPAYGIHIVRRGRAISHVGYVDDFGPPVVFGRDETQEG